MSQSCGNLQFVEGGVIKNSSIINSQITDSIITNSVLQAVRLENLTGLDDISAKVIVDALAALPSDQLAPLVSAILTAFVTSPHSEPVSSIGGGELPTTIYGDRTALLGDPELFVKFGKDYVIPLYRPEV